MSKFLTGEELEKKLTDILWNAKKDLVIISPFIKLDDHVKKVLEKAKSTHEINVYIVFGKNEEYKYKSFSEEDFEFFTEFKNIAILYNKNLHAKHYSNESEGLITSLNLYGYSMLNNIEYGVHFSKTILNPLDKLFEDTYDNIYDLIHLQSEVVYLKKPQYSNKLFGLKKVYQQSKLMHDISEDFFNNSFSYQPKKLLDFDLNIETDIEKKFDQKPIRKEAKPSPKASIKKAPYKKKQYNTGYCIRTGEEIPYNPEQPMCKSAWKTWNMFGDQYYPEQYCHKTGKESNGKTSMANPILKY